ncbi:MAG: hydroxymethylpyrimidine/phosphomethylpyrimidine kinase [Planctomycetes bacterium]|nr:hydroxymethylpyrimidine/phosphomethylpyrimidine kinase [Planctomycetota bacterium]
MSGPRVLVAGGVDPSGGAGVTADVRMAWALGVHPTVAVTCLTVQSRHRFHSLEPVAGASLAAALTAVAEDGPVHAVKIGMAGSGDLLRLLVAHCTTAWPAAPLVVDPVLGTTSGQTVAGAELLEAYRELLPHIALLTPNHPELARLAPGGVDELRGLGARAVLLKDGHGSAAVVEDRLWTARGSVTFRHPRLDCGAVHGTGCALATAVAARLARGGDLEASCRGAVADVAASLRDTPRSADGAPAALHITASRTQG